MPEEIWCMPYADALLVWNELEEHPPVRMLFAQFVGYKKPKPFTGVTDPDDFFAMQKIIGPVAPAMPPELRAALNWAEDLKKKHPALAH